MVPLRPLLPVLGAMFLSGCGGLPIGEFTADGLQSGAFLPLEPNQAVKNTAANEIAPADGNAAVKRVAFTLTPVRAPESDAYKIGPRDVLEITVFRVPELSRTFQVSEAGTINYPLIGEVRAGGKTAREVEQTLTKALGTEYLQKPQITVFVKEHNSQRITIDGAVKKPGVYSMAGGLSLLQAVAQAQGLEPTAQDTVVVFRQENEKRTAGKFDIAAIRDGRTADPQLRAGDVIVVATDGKKTSGCAQ